MPDISDIDIDISQNSLIIQNACLVLGRFFRNKVNRYRITYYNNQSFSLKHGYNNILSPTTRLISRIVTPTSNSLQNGVKKSNQGNMSHAEYIRYKIYRQEYPKQQVQYAPIDVPIVTTSSFNSQEAQIIAADGIAPAFCVDGWKFVNTNPEKINWYFYADGSVGPPGNTPTASYKISDLECFYFVVDLSNGAQINEEYNKPWITMYSQYDTTSSYNNVSWYRSRFNYSGFHDKGVDTSLNSGTYIFYVGDLTTLSSYDTALTAYNLSSYDNDPVETPSPGPTYLRSNAPDLSTALDERLNLIAISTNSGAATGTFDFCIKEVGYKLKGLPQFVYDLE